MTRPVSLYREVRKRKADEKAAAKRAERESAKAENSFRSNVGLIFKDADGIERLSFQLCQKGPSGHEIAHCIVNVEDGVITGCYVGSLLKAREAAIKRLAMIHFKKAWPKEPCPHYQDNQGFCHKCGILMCEETARSEGYWQEGMVEGK